MSPNLVELNINNRGEEKLTSISKKTWRKTMTMKQMGKSFKRANKRQALKTFLAGGYVIYKRSDYDLTFNQKYGQSKEDLDKITCKGEWYVEKRRK